MLLIAVKTAISPCVRKRRSDNINLFNCQEFETVSYLKTLQTISSMVERHSMEVKDVGSNPALLT